MRTILIYDEWELKELSPKDLIFYLRTLCAATRDVPKAKEYAVKLINQRIHEIGDEVRLLKYERAVGVDDTDHYIH